MRVWCKPSNESPARSRLLPVTEREVSKVIRKTTNAKGLTAEKEYTAYSIG